MKNEFQKKENYIPLGIQIYRLETEKSFTIGSIHNAQGYPLETWQDGGEETQTGFWQ